MLIDQMKALDKLIFVLKWFLAKTVIESIYDGAFYILNYGLKPKDVHCHKLVDPTNWWSWTSSLVWIIVEI